MASGSGVGVELERAPRDIFGNLHAPDEVGYCECWQCPKQYGPEYPFNTWWQPDLRYTRGQR